MSTCSHEVVTNNHEGLFAQLSAVFHTWRERQHQRRELALWTERDLHDVGLSWSEVVREVEKPFWRS